MEIYKFGGASVKNAAALENVAQIVLGKKSLWIVVSAIDKTTNALERLVKSWFNNDSDKEFYLNSVIDFHIEYINEAFTEKADVVIEKIEIYFNELSEIIDKEANPNYDKSYDLIVSYGELFSTLIASEYLKNKSIENTFADARNIIVTDENNRDAKILWTESEQKLAELKPNNEGIYIIQGFIGQSASGSVTTLGREGSDYTASALAYLLNAESVTIWKDVPGIMNADPAWCDFAEKLDVLSYLEAIELAFFGAKVIHPKTIKPIENKNIPLYVKSFIKPEESGTVIKNLDYKLKLIPVYILKEDQTSISISPKDFSFIVEENMSNIFGLFAKYKAKVNITQNSAVSFSASIDGDNRNFEQLINELQNDYFVKYNTGLELITIRYYDEEAINKMIAGKKIFIEQRSRKTARFLV